MQSIPYKICYSTVYHTFGEKYAQRFVRNRGDFYRFANMPLPERTRKIYVGRYVHFEAETAAEVSRY